MGALTMPLLILMLEWLQSGLIPFSHLTVLHLSNINLSWAQIYPRVMYGAACYPFKPPMPSLIFDTNYQPMQLMISQCLLDEDSASERSGDRESGTGSGAKPTTNHSLRALISRFGCLSANKCGQAVVCASGNIYRWSDCRRSQIDTGSPSCAVWSVEALIWARGASVLELVKKGSQKG